MNLFFRSLYVLFPPRLPRFGPEDVAVTAEYFNRMARHYEWTMDPPDTWVEPLPTQLTARIPPFKIALNVSHRILRRVAPPSKSLAERAQGTASRILFTGAPTRRAFEWVLSMALTFFSPTKFHLTSAEGSFRGRASS
jgi:hypothetical protein